MASPRLVFLDAAPDQLAETARRPDAVHQARIRVRRIRSVLSVYRRLFAREATQERGRTPRTRRGPRRRRATSEVRAKTMEDLLAARRPRPMSMRCSARRTSQDATRRYERRSPRCFAAAHAALLTGHAARRPAGVRCRAAAARTRQAGIRNASPRAGIAKRASTRVHGRQPDLARAACTSCARRPAGCGTRPTRCRANRPPRSGRGRSGSPTRPRRHRTCSATIATASCSPATCAHVRRDRAQRIRSARPASGSSHRATARSRPTRELEPPRRRARRHPRAA